MRGLLSPLIKLVVFLLVTAMATYVRQQEISHAVGQAGSLMVKLTEADVHIRPADGNEIHVRATFEIGAGSDEEADSILDAVKLVVSSGASYLDIRSQETGQFGLRQALGIPNGQTLKRWITGQPRVALSVEIEAPTDCELRMETVSGDFTIEGMRGEQQYKTVSGDLYATNLGGVIRLSTVSGDATVRGADVLALTANSVSGDLSAMAPRFRELRLNAVSGDLEIEGELARDGTFRAETLSGDLTIGLLGGGSFEVRGISSDIHADIPHRIEGRSDRRRVVIGDGTPTFLFSSMSGDVSIRRPRRLDQDAPTPPGAPAPPSVPAASSGAGARPTRAADAVDSLEILRALERGEIDVDEASRRLARGSRDA